MRTTIDTSWTAKHLDAAQKNGWTIDSKHGTERCGYETILRKNHQDGRHTLLTLGSYPATGTRKDDRLALLTGPTGQSQRITLSSIPKVLRTAN